MNIGLLAVFIPSDQNRLSALNVQLSTLSTENSQLHSRMDKIAASGSLTDGSVASLQAPAVTQVTTTTRGKHPSQTVVENGSIMNISVEVVPGQGRVLVETKPLMSIVFQDAANSAVGVAINKTRANLSKSDVIFSIDAGNHIGEVDGPSAGALMTLLTVAAIEKRPVNQTLTLTGTINEDGSIGAIGGVVAKATAARDSGKTLFLIPLQNQLIPPPSSGTGTFSTTLPVNPVSAKDYIEKNVGIRVAYINSIDDVLAVGLK